MKEAITVAIVDDDEGFLERVKKIVAATAGYQVVAVFHSFHHAAREIPSLHPQLVIIDHQLNAGKSGGELFEHIHDDQMHVIYITQHKPRHYEEAGKDHEFRSLFKQDKDFDTALAVALQSFRTHLNSIYAIETRSQEGRLKGTVEIQLMNRENVRISPEDIMFISQERKNGVVKIGLINNSFDALFKNFTDALERCRGNENFQYTRRKQGCGVINMRHFNGTAQGHKVKVQFGSRLYTLDCSQEEYKKFTSME